MSGDNAPKSGRIQPTPPVPIAVPRGAPTAPTGDRFDTAAALLRLIVGGTLLGADELRARLERWQEDARSAAQLAQVAPPRSASSSLRAAFVGMLFETESRMRWGFSILQERLTRISDEANLRYATRAPALRNTPLDAVQTRLDNWLFLVQAVVDRWTERGWAEEQQGRRLAQQAAVGVIDDLLDYMAQNPEVRKLIEEQGMGMAESTMDEVRGRSEAADRWIERLAHSLLHRPLSDQSASPAGSVEAPPAAAVQANSTAPSIRPRAPGAKAQPSSAALAKETRPLGAPGA